MAISRKPKTNAEASQTVDVDALISKGGSVARTTSTAEEGEKEKPVIVRVPEQLLEKIDRTVRARPIKTPRHTWLLEAIIEKLERETA